MKNPIDINERFQLAADFIQFSSMPVFLTGKAGTGKTTFLKYIRDNCTKNMAVLAPTGVAAINAGGTTIHSFFQLPFTPFIPHGNGKHELLGRLRFNSDRRKLFQQLELLVIDEISMVRADVLDAIDTILRWVRNQAGKPFGGVQLLYIGDVFQLSPVVKNEGWELLSGFYKSPYFFDSLVIQQQPPVYVELDRIYRQTDIHFIELLNCIRNNRLDDKNRQLLNSRFLPDQSVDIKDAYITLTTHNHTAEEINKKELAQLKGKEYSFKAAVQGDFSEKAYPADAELLVKTGARVMFLKNDTEKVRRYFNGKIGEITSIGEDKIMVQCTGDDKAIEVKKETWENIRYVHDKTTNQVEEEVIGSFSQYPLRLAWAITIHKSQGLTFEKTVIDAGAAFAAGQVYVALSRCTSLEGIILKSRISEQSLKTDQRIINYISGQSQQTATLPDYLEASKSAFQQETILRLFDMSAIAVEMQTIISWFGDHKKSFNAETENWLKEISERIHVLDTLSIKFEPILRGYFNSQVQPQYNPELVKRLAAAAEHYTGHLDFIKTLFRQSPASTDSITEAREFYEKMSSVFEQLDLLTHSMGCCRQSFSLESLQATRSSYQGIALKNTFYAGKFSPVKNTSKNPELYNTLKQIRDHICDTTGLPVYMVCSSAALTDMADYLPQTPDELLKIDGFGKIKAERWGKQFLEPIRSYCSDHNLETTIGDKPAKPGKEKTVKKDKKADTRSESLRLLQSGKTIAEIAAERNLTQGTVKGHIALLITGGQIGIDTIIPVKGQLAIRKILEQYPGENLSGIMHHMPAEYDYGDVRMVIAAMEKEQQ